MEKTVTYKELMELGFPEKTARNIIRDAKLIAVEKFKKDRINDSNSVQLIRSPFDNKRLGIAPRGIVEKLLGGISLSENLKQKNILVFILIKKIEFILALNLEKTQFLGKGFSTKRVELRKENLSKVKKKHMMRLFVLNTKMEES